MGKCRVVTDNPLNKNLHFSASVFLPPQAGGNNPGIIENK